MEAGQVKALLSLPLQNPLPRKENRPLPSQGGGRVSSIVSSLSSSQTPTDKSPRESKSETTTLAKITTWRVVGINRRKTIRYASASLRRLNVAIVDAENQATDG